MNKRANILLNTMIILSFSSLVFLGMARSNHQVHQIETRIFEQEVPVTYMDYTIELFDEDMNGHFDYYIENPTQYDSTTFRQILRSRIDGLTGFSYKRDSVSDNELDFWEHFVHIIRNNGYRIQGVDTYVIGIDLPDYEAEYQIDLAFEKTWEYKRNYISDWFWCSWFDSRRACDAIRDEDNYEIRYIFTDDSRGTLTELDN